MAVSTFNNQYSHQPPESEPPEGWGTELVAIVDATVEFRDGTQETYRQFTIDTSPARDTLNVYTLEGKQLTYGKDYVHDDCDLSGRSYRIVENSDTRSVDPCSGMYALFVTYLVVAPTLRTPRHPGRTSDTNVGHDRLRDDIRGL